MKRKQNKRKAMSGPAGKLFSAAVARLRSEWAGSLRRLAALYRANPVVPRARARLARARRGFLFVVTGLKSQSGRADLSRVLRYANRPFSPSWLVLPRPLWAVPSMLVASACIIALETLLFHLLLIVSDYLVATSIIGMAMFGIALGGFISFLFSRLQVLFSTAAAAVGLFVSIIFSYSTVIAVWNFDFPWPLILPFFFASFIVSNVFAAGGSANILNFANCLGSGVGVVIPLVLIPLVKSETTILLLLLLPAVLALLVSFRARHLVVKLAVLAVVLLTAGAVIRTAEANLALPEVIGADVFEKKIIPAAGPDFREKRAVNQNWDFFKSVYKRDGSVYRFMGDRFDRERAWTLLSYVGSVERFPVPGLTVREGAPSISDPHRIPADVFEGELERAFAARFKTILKQNDDLAFLKRVYRKDGGVYRLEGSGYDRLRAKYLLAEYGIRPFYDLFLDVRRHGSLRDRSKFYATNERVLLSEDDLLGRLEYTGDEKSQLMAMNGVYLDSIDPYNGAHWDPRVPRVDFLNNPAVFIIGLSADGIVKSVKRLPGAVTAGVELHPSVFRTMTEDGQFAAMANRPYDGVEARQGEGRSFLENDPRRWDMIALMNIHPEHGPYNTVSPENLHTVEGVRVLLDRLTERGIIVYEEIITNARSELAFQKFLFTCRATLAGTKDPAEEPLENPARCFYVFRWDFWEGSSVFRTLILRRKPFSREEVRQFDLFYDAIAAEYPGTSLLYNPYRTLQTTYEQVIRGKIPETGEYLPTVLSADELLEKIVGRLSDPRDAEFVLSRYAWGGRAWFLKSAGLSDADRLRLLTLFRRAGYPVETDLSPATDDRPFPYAVWREKTEITDVINRLLFLVLFLAIPLLVLLVHGSGAPRKILLPAVLFTALSGFGFMLVEIILLQRFQLFIGDPTWTLVTVLGGMLVLSGLGSLTGHFLPRRIVGIASGLIPVVLFCYLFFLGDVFKLLSGLPLSGKLWASLLVLLPGSFLMGMPFPAAMEMVKQRSSGGFAALLFGISGGVSTLATAIALLINVVHGFTASFTLGAVLYAAGFLLFLVLLMLTRQKAAA